MKTTYTTIVWKDKEKNATGLQVPADTIAALQAGKKPKVKVSLNGYSYRTTVGVMSDKFMIPLSAENREAAGVNAGDQVDVMLELDTEHRTVDVPDDFASALQAHHVMATFDGLSYSVRKEYVRQVVSAKAQETRNRRIDGIVAKLRG